MLYGKTLTFSRQNDTLMIAFYRFSPTRTHVRSSILTEIPQLQNTVDDILRTKQYSIKTHIKEKYTVKPVLSGHSKIDQTKILMTNGSLMKVESIAECSNIFDQH